VLREGGVLFFLQYGEIQASVACSFLFARGCIFVYYVVYFHVNGRKETEGVRNVGAEDGVSACKWENNRIEKIE
jgi:hypothetical protein